MCLYNGFLLKINNGMMVMGYLQLPTYYSREVPDEKLKLIVI